VVTAVLHLLFTLWRKVLNEYLEMSFGEKYLDSFCFDTLSLGLISMLFAAIALKSKLDNFPFFLSLCLFFFSL